MISLLDLNFPNNAHINNANITRWHTIFLHTAFIQSSQIKRNEEKISANFNNDKYFKVKHLLDKNKGTF